MGTGRRGTRTSTLSALAVPAISAALVAALAATSTPAAAQPPMTPDGGADDAVMVRILGIDGIAGSLSHPPGYQGTILDGPDRTIPAGGADYLSATVSHLRAGAENSVLLSTGDNLGGVQPEAVLNRDEPTLQVLRHMGVAASAIGELDLVAPSAATMPEHGFPYIASNLAPGDDAPITPFPYLVIDVGGIKIGVIAATTGSENMEAPPPLYGPPTPAPPPWHPEHRPLQESFDAATRALEAMGVNSVVGLLHIDAVHRQNDPAACPEEIAEMPELREVSSSVDALFVGDSGGPATCDLTDPTNARRPVLSPASHGRSVAVVDLLIDPTTGRAQREQSSTYNQKVHHDITPDAEVTDLIDAATASAAENDTEVFGSASEKVSREILPSGESALANLMADAQWEATRDEGADLAIYNPDSLRTDLPEGELSYRDLHAVQPYGDRVQIATVSGDRLRDAFNAYIDDVGTRGIAVSENVELDIDPTRPEGERLVGAKIDGTEIEPGREYKVAANEFLVSSEWGAAPLTTLTSEPEWSGLFDIHTLAEYVRSHKTVRPPAVNQRLLDVSAGS